MRPEAGTRLPTLIVSSVVRSTHQGESHGGVYLVDMASGAVEQVIDWNDAAIDWEGRGGDRGLRGIAFAGDRLFLAASDEIFVYDRRFRRQGSLSNRYLKHCHEIFVAGDRLFVASTGFDSALEFDLSSERFMRGYCLRFAELWRARRRLRIRPRPSFRIFDPGSADGPAPADTAHLNNVFVADDWLFASGVNMGTVWCVRGERLRRFARIPYGSHNARPFRDGVLMNHTATDRVAYVGRYGKVLRSFPLPRYAPGELLHAELTADKARPAFGRGLAVLDDDHFVGGSSPATVTLYRFDSSEPLRSVNITMDVRNAVHGLEVWPFDGG
jgi:hypothetical protein